MSRAFVKEDDAGTQEVQVDLPMSEHPNFVTPAGLKMLRDKVKEFEDERARLREHEDELATQSHLPRVEQELRYWEERLRTAISIDLARQPRDKEIGRASCRERVCQYVSIPVVAVSLIKKILNKHS